MALRGWDLTKSVKFHIRFSKKPKENPSKDFSYKRRGRLWENRCDVLFLGEKTDSESTWEMNWFKRNPVILKMIKTNDKEIAQKISEHEREEIAFLAKEILNGNKIIIKIED